MLIVACVVSGGLLAIGLFCIFRRIQRCKSKRSSPGNRRIRIQWLYITRPRIYLTRRSYQRAKEANAVGRDIIKKRESTYASMPLAKVRRE